MGASMRADVRAFLARVPRNRRETVKALRELVLAAAGGTVESVLWRSLSYHRPELGGRVKGAVCLITPKTDHGVAVAGASFTVLLAHDGKVVSPPRDRSVPFP